MARVRYIGAEPVTVPELGKTVHPDELVTVPDERYEGYVCQPTTWEAAEEPKPDQPKKTTAAKSATTPKTEG